MTEDLDKLLTSMFEATKKNFEMIEYLAKALDKLIDSMEQVIGLLKGK